MIVICIGLGFTYLIHQIFTFYCERNFFDFRIVIAIRAFEFRVWSI
jgi:hypothetical protein